MTAAVSKLKAHLRRVGPVRLGLAVLLLALPWLTMSDFYTRLFSGDRFIPTNASNPITAADTARIEFRSGRYEMERILPRFIDAGGAQEIAHGEKFSARERRALFRPFDLVRKGREILDFSDAEIE